jgi:hypothetical protein
MSRAGRLRHSDTFRRCPSGNLSNQKRAVGLSWVPV